MGSVGPINASIEVLKTLPTNKMNFLDLPVEILRLIVQHSWNSQLRQLSTFDRNWTWRFEASGVADWNLQSTCRLLGDMTKEVREKSFSGKMYIDEVTSAISPIYETFIESTQTNARFEWIRRNITVLRFSNPNNNPAVWRFGHSLYGPALPKLQRIELDCRYRFHFAVHNVDDAEEFLSGRDGKLEKLIDFRQSFFLGCEKFLNYSVRHGVTVRVIRDMGVREGTDRCKAVVSSGIVAVTLRFADKVKQAVAIDYVADDAGRLVLDWNSLQCVTAVINGWPGNIRGALGTLNI